MATIGLRDVHYAILTSDNASGAVYETPVKIAGAISANVNPNTNSATLLQTMVLMILLQPWVRSSLNLTWQIFRHLHRLPFWDILTQTECLLKNLLISLLMLLLVTVLLRAMVHTDIPGCTRVSSLTVNRTIRRRVMILNIRHLPSRIFR